MKHIIVLALLIILSVAANAQCPLNYRIANSTNCSYCVRIKYADCASGATQFTDVTSGANTQTNFLLPFTNTVITVQVFQIACGSNSGTNAIISSSAPTSSVGDCASASTNNVFWQSTHETWIYP